MQTVTTPTTTVSAADQRHNARVFLRTARARLEHARELERAALVERIAAVERGRAAGLTTADIAAVLGISRQAVHLIG